MIGRSFGILLAAGLGRRLGADEPKAFVNIEGRSILERSLSQMISSETFNQIIVAVPQDKISNVASQYKDIDMVHFVVGGEERADSVRCALQYLMANLTPGELDIVTVHDAARCFATENLFKRVVEEAKQHGAVTAAVPSSDSIKLVRDDGTVESSLDRSRTWIVQTPQAFWFKLLWQGHQDATVNATDDASLVERIHTVRVVLGEPTNIKVTFPHDIPSWQN